MISDGAGRPLVMLLSEIPTSDYKAAALIVDDLPPAKALLADKGYDADWFRDALSDQAIQPCIPCKSNTKEPLPHDQAL